MPIITISRGTFTDGQAFAECLAERLGYRCLSREALLASASAAYGIPTDALTTAMDRPPSFWERLIGERGSYLNYVRAALSDRARADNIIYHGHVGHLLLAGISHVVRVRVVEDEETRARMAMKQHNLGREQAIARVRQVDRERTEWTRFLWGVEWKDSALYDVVLNLTRIGVSGACEVVARMVELEAFRPTAASLKAMEDLALGSRVWAALATDSQTADADVDVSANDGTVTITGTTHSQGVVESIPIVALRVEGVRDVRSDVVETPVFYEPI